ncbi:MAG: histidine kinase [Pseudomonadota bacterium]
MDQANSKETDIELNAAIVTWLIVTGLALYFVFDDPQRFMGVLELAIVLFTANFAAMIGTTMTRLSARRRQASHVVQLLSALAVGWLLGIDFLQIYTIIWIGMAASYYSFRWCLSFVPILALVWFVILSNTSSNTNELLSVSLFATFHLFALLSSHAAIRAERARERTEMLYRELVATQHLLTEASRQSERTRIARNLHDLLGHHLTALTINLQIAERLAEGEAKEQVSASRALTKLLLSDVRESVSTLREQSALDLHKALHLLVENVPHLSIELDIDPTLSIEDVQIADALMRCVQEAITNTLKHANAERQWIRIWQADGKVHFQAHDDGRVQGDPEEGNGLAGMRERLQSVNGSLSIERMSHALQLSASIPLHGQ